MDQRATYNRGAQLITILLVALVVKQLYSSSGVNELRWILAPTSLLVELVSGATFSFESHAGYMSSDRRLLIAASCAGVNFLITAFLMLSLARLWRRNLTWKFIPCAMVFAYIATLVANTVRIVTALQLQQSPSQIPWLSSNQVHRLEGILIYFGFLLMLFLVADRRNNMGSEKPAWRIPGSLRSANATQLFGQLFFPLLIYYATTLGIPLANAAYHRDMAVSAFLEHSVFVLLAPLLLIIPVVAFRLFRIARPAKASS